MLDYVCITGIRSSCQMRFYGCNYYCHSLVVYYVVEICWQVSSCRYVECHVLNYLSQANVIYGDYFITSVLYFLHPMEDWVPSYITYVFWLLSALFLWLQLVCEGLYIQTLRQFFGALCIRILTGCSLYVLHRRFCNNNGDFSWT